MSVLVVNSAQRFAPKTSQRDGEEMYRTPDDVVLETWGIRDSSGNDINMGWKRSGHRKPNDHGFISDKSYQTEYGKSLFEAMFKGWK